MGYTRLPATVWPLTIRHTEPHVFTTPASERRPNPFGRTTVYERTLRELHDELRHLEATAAWMQLVLGNGEADLRQDGQLRSKADVRHPGVVLTITTRAHGTLVYTCDRHEGRWTHDPPDWQINLRAITVGLHDLRRLDRYGIADRGQQYAGFRELGAGTAMAGGTHDADSLARYLAIRGGLDVDGVDAAAIGELKRDPEYVQLVFRAAAKAHHPDVGGSAATMAALTTARDYLLNHIGGR